MAERTSILSRTIDVLRFPIILGVVAEHAFFPAPSQEACPVFDTTRFLLSDVTTEVIPPPLFFLVSAMLFFWGVNKWTSKSYLGKIGKRARTLLIPYIFWNLLIIGVLFIGQSYFPDLAGKEAAPVSGYSVSDWLWSFWDTSRGTAYASATVGDPAYFPFWFIRDVMVLFVLSPIIWFLVKRTGLAVVAAAGAWWIAAGFPDIPRWVYGVTGFSPRAVFFFTLGAWLILSGKGWAEGLLKSRNSVRYLVPLVLAGIVGTYVMKGRYLYQPYIRIYTITAVTLCFCLAARWAQKKKEGGTSAGRFLAASAFFLYASHGFPVKLLPHIIIQKTGIHSDLQITALYFVSLAVVAALCLGVYALMKKAMPRVLSFITGGRC